MFHPPEHPPPSNRPRWLVRSFLALAIVGIVGCLAIFVTHLVMHLSGIASGNILFYFAIGGGTCTSVLWAIQIWLNQQGKHN